MVQIRRAASTPFSMGLPVLPNSALLLGDGRVGSVSDGILRGLVQLGWEVHPVSLGTFLPDFVSDPLRMSLAVVRPWIRREYNRYIRKVISLAGASYLIVVQTDLVSEKTMAVAGEHGMFRVLYLENFVDLQRATRILVHFDRVAVTSAALAERLSRGTANIEVAIVYPGYIELLHRPLRTGGDEDGEELDVAFVGTASRSRAVWVAEIMSRLRPMKVVVLGSGWEHSRVLPGSVAALRRWWEVDGYAKTVSQSRISVVMPPGSGESPGGVTADTFAIPACCGFMLHPSGAAETVFERGEEIDVYRNLKDLESRIYHYLERAAERHAMARRAYSRCVPAYGWINQVRALLETERFPV